ncbi:ABC transporter ATP-binding protein [Penaeicola halotolerans]|uniref:ABC transporter ATP-binding protein n=1 Tax=Penaeicola halotolerans TaxID=2793196 RepID=UPI001CF885F6|nr:ABC transporter ATP-binding protein [Penaeicola halotolerans]
MSTIIETKNLTKKYGSFVAVDGVSFHLEKGQVLGVIGPNGSGKTTLFSMLLGLRKKTSGEMRVFDQENLDGIRNKMGIIMDQGAFYNDFSAHKNLTISAMTKGVDLSRVTELIDKVDLRQAGKRTFNKFSYGMRKRLEIADALLTDPELVIMDEPTNGLDPDGIRFIRELIFHLQEQGKTIMLSSHYLDEIEKVCTHFLMLRNGKVVFYGSKEEIKAQNLDLESIFSTKF